MLKFSLEFLCSYNSLKNHDFFYLKVSPPKELNNMIFQRLPQITFLFANSCCCYYYQCQYSLGKNTLCQNNPYPQSSGNETQTVLG